MTFDPTKPCMTRDGRPVALITTQGREPWPLVGYIGGDTYPSFWTVRGDFEIEDDLSCPYDLINTPEPKRSGEVWVNVYLNGAVTWNSRADADKCAASRVACVHVPWTEGEGLVGK